jgi:DNA-binding HxlR family transcriptional regulator
MPTKRTYADHGDACRAANALDLVGDRWTLIVIRELILGPKRFADLQAAVRGITPAVLTDRLRALQDAGIVEQVAMPDLAGTRAYVTTEWGRELESVLQSLGRWYSTGPDPATSGGMTPDAIVLAMRTMAPPTPDDLPALSLKLFDARRPGTPPRNYQVGTEDGLLHAEPGVPNHPAATVTADATTWSEVLFGELALTDAERAELLRIEGDRYAVARVAALFSQLSAGS